MCKKLFLGFLAVFGPLFLKEGWGQSLQQVNSFGSNPGDLRMYEYEPNPQPQGQVPLLVVFHGCGQSANSYFNDTEWYRLADRYGFYLLFPEQKTINNSANCFNWFLSSDQQRGSGEAKSVRQMVDRMKTDHAIDNGSVYVTGLSAGGAMTAVMMACYPEVFSAGAVMAGLPYKAASDFSRAQKAMNGKVDSTPSEWKNLAENAYSSYNGDYPKLATFHGSSDGTVDPVNARELMEQWTAVHGADQTVDRTQYEIAGASSVTRENYSNGSGSIVVSRYTVQGMDHGIPVDPGNPLCKGKGGSIGTNAFDVELFSSYWAARFFGIIPYAEVMGPTAVNTGQQGVVFSTPSVQGSSWNWEVPSGASIVSGQGTDSIEVDWGSQTGYVKVTRTDSNGCVGLPDSMAVGLTGIESHRELPDGVRFLGPNPSDHGFRIRLDASSKEAVRLKLYDGSGQQLSLSPDVLTPGAILHFGRELDPGFYHLRVGDGSRSLIVR